MREKVGKSRSTVFFRMVFVAPEGWKVGSLKRRVQRLLGRWGMKKLHAVVARSTFGSQNVLKHTEGLGPLLEGEMLKKCTPLWREAHFEVKMYKTHQGSRTTFGSWDVEKVHAVVVRSTFRSQNVQNTPALGPLLEVEMSKKVHAVVARSTFRSQNVQNTSMFATTFGGSDLEKVHAVLARSTFRSQNVQNTRGSDHFWRFRCRFASLRVITLHYTLHYTTVHYTPHYTPQHYNYRTTLNYTPLHSTTLNYNTLRHITLHSTTLHYITLHYTLHYYTTLHYTTLYTPLHYATLHYTIHSTHYSTLHYTTLHNTTTTTTELHNYTPLHSTTLHYTPLH